MTEADAKTKRCCGPPAIAHAAYWKGGADVGDTPMLCLGSVCMAWMWSDNGSVNAVRARSDKSEGFCGLAGAVQ